MASHHDPQQNPDNATPREKGKKKIIIIPIALILIAVATFMLWPANISRQGAGEIALAHVTGGTANRASRDFERFQRVWSVEVFHDGLVHEVYVSMRTGEVVRVEVDRWD